MGLRPIHSRCLCADAGDAKAAGGLAALQLNATPDAAAGLLKSIGWWRPHEQLSLLRLGITSSFDARLLVRSCTALHTHWLPVCP